MSENTKTIGGRVISVGKLPATKAVTVQVALVNLCGEAIFKAASGKGTDQEAIGASALSALSSRLDSSVLLGAMNTTLVNYVSIDGKRIADLDSAFADHVEDMWPTFWYALQVNFAAFFRGGLFASIKAKAEKLSQSTPQTSIGTSADQ